MHRSVRYGSLHPKSVVSQAQKEAFGNYVNKEEAGHHVYDIPNEEVKTIGKLLGIPESEVPPIKMKFPDGRESCKNCGRMFTFLDILHTGLETQSQEFWRDMVTGKFGFVMNAHNRGGEAQPGFKCYNCGQPNS